MSNDTAFENFLKNSQIESKQEETFDTSLPDQEETVTSKLEAALLGAGDAASLGGSSILSGVVGALTPEKIEDYIYGNEETRALKEKAESKMKEFGIEDQQKTGLSKVLDDYYTVRDKSISLKDRALEEHPMTYLGSSVVGGIGTAAPIAGIAQKLSQTGKIGKTIGSVLPKIPEIGTKPGFSKSVLDATIEGTKAGGLSSLMGGEAKLAEGELTKTLGDTTKGVVFGGLFGAGLGAVGHGVGKVGEWFGMDKAFNAGQRIQKEGYGEDQLEDIVKNYRNEFANDIYSTLKQSKNELGSNIGAIENFAEKAGAKVNLGSSIDDAVQSTLNEMRESSVTKGQEGTLEFLESISDPKRKLLNKIVEKQNKLANKYSDLLKKREDLIQKGQIASEEAVENIQSKAGKESQQALQKVDKRIGKAIGEGKLDDAELGKEFVIDSPGEYIQGELDPNLKVIGRDVQLMGEDEGGKIVATGNRPFAESFIEKPINQEMIDKAAQEARGSVDFDLEKTGRALGETEQAWMRAGEEIPDNMQLKPDLENLSIKNTNQVIAEVSNQLDSLESRGQKGSGEYKRLLDLIERMKAERDEAIRFGTAKGTGEGLPNFKGTYKEARDRYATTEKVLKEVGFTGDKQIKSSTSDLMEIPGIKHAEELVRSFAIDPIDTRLTTLERHLDKMGIPESKMENIRKDLGFYKTISSIYGDTLSTGLDQGLWNKVLRKIQEANLEVGKMSKSVPEMAERLTFKTLSLTDSSPTKLQNLAKRIQKTNLKMADLARQIDEVANADKFKRTATMFSLMQNPAYRELINSLSQREEE